MKSLKFIQSQNQSIYVQLVNFLDSYELTELDRIIEAYANADISGNDPDFEAFWEQYHKITGLPKTDKEAAIKRWKALKKKEKVKAFEMVELWFQSIKKQKFYPKCRTYLANKNFNDEIKTPKNEENRRSYEGRIHQK